MESTFTPTDTTTWSRFSPFIILGDFSHRDSNIEMVHQYTKLSTTSNDEAVTTLTWMTIEIGIRCKLSDHNEAHPAQDLQPCYDFVYDERHLQVFFYAEFGFSLRISALADIWFHDNMRLLHKAFD